MSENVSPCAKCSHDQLFVVNPFQVRNYEYSNSTNPLYVATGDTHKDDIGSLELRVCAACGFAEWWAGDLAALRKAAAVRGSKVRLVRVPAAGYR